MFGLGLRLTLRSGKEAFTRLLLTAVAVGIGTTILLAALADFHAFQAVNNRPAWEKTGQASDDPSMSSGRTLPTTQGKLLWNYNNDIFKGKTIERLEVAAVSADAPVLPGISKMPTAGEYYASPALSNLLRSTPYGMLGARFPGKQVGVIGKEALTSPDELVIFIGYNPADLRALPTTIGVNTISTAPQTNVWTGYFRYAYIFGTIALLFPILILIGTATRLAAARREERFAALRLVGATPNQLNIIASIDALVSALVGALLGIGVFQLIQSSLAKASITGGHYFVSDVTPTILGYAAVLFLVPIASAVAALISLRRVRISPLGVSRKTTPPAPKVWRILPLLAGIGLFVLGVVMTTHETIAAPIYLGLILILTGFVVGGPWLTMVSARILSKLLPSASSLLAARRLANDPKTAFRAVSGLVLAAFLGTTLAALLPSINSTTATPSATALQNVLLVSFTPGVLCGNEVNCTGADRPMTTNDGEFGLFPQAGAALLSGLRGFSGITTIPLYANPEAIAAQQQMEKGMSGPGKEVQGDSIISCTDLQKVSALGKCPAGAQAVIAQPDFMSDNPSYSTQAIASTTSKTTSDNFSELYMSTLLIKVNNPIMLEKVRTFLATHTSKSLSGTAPRTFGEAITIRLAISETIQRIFNGAVALTLFIAGCSLAVTVGGSMVERKRPFGLLRLSGVPTSTLYRVVLYEAVMPLLGAVVTAASIGYGIALITVKKIGAPGMQLPTLGHNYFIVMGLGLITSLIVILLTLPLLGRITKPDEIRFE
ncbi:MAG TPA: FtsX-like permease family protein [Candidatus Saccharimonadales bacterium]|nr:FtsX-like permease family protein [Candidatus Saccharimonadales bacterium]